MREYRRSAKHPVLGLGAARRRPRGEAVGVERVDPLGQVEAVVEPFGLAERGEPAGHAVERPGAVLLLDHGAQVAGLGRGGRVQLEGVPAHVEAVGPLRPELVEGELEASVPQVAPGADHVGPDVDAHGAANPGFGGGVPGPVGWPPCSSH